MTEVCPVCRNATGRPFVELEDQPVSIGVQWPGAEQARACGKGDLRLVYCPGCGFIWNRAFDPERLEYSQRYDNSLDFSPAFQDYARNLACRLVDTYGLRGKDVIELGCGKGHFLSLICDEGGNRGIGFDPSYDGSRVRNDRVTYIADFYGGKHTAHRGDLVCCRHVFEHIPDPVAFLSTVRQTIGDDESTVVYFEVPNARLILEKLSVWDLIYEHCNYFSRESLAAVFRHCGFQVLRMEESYSGQFLSLDARVGNGTSEDAGDLTELESCVDEFSRKMRERTDAWSARLADWRQTGKRAVLWGGGAKAVGFLNMLHVTDTILYVVDINPHKQGRHLAGTGQQVVAPAFLREYRPDVVVLMNPVYRPEIAAELEALGVSAELVDV